MNHKVRDITHVVAQWSWQHWRGLTVIVVIIMGLWLNNTSLFVPTQHPRILAHRGLAQTFDYSKVGNDTNTAAIIDKPEHPYLENTIPSMRAAFDHGADVVELDLKLTKDQQLAVFHDSTLEYRTEAEGEIGNYTMAELKQLDIGYGYTADGGKTFPFRGKGVGLMPTLMRCWRPFHTRIFFYMLRTATTRRTKCCGENSRQWTLNASNK